MKRAHDAIFLSIAEIDTLIDIFKTEADVLLASREQDCVQPGNVR